MYRTKRNAIFVNYVVVEHRMLGSFAKFVKKIPKSKFPKLNGEKIVPY